MTRPEGVGYLTGLTAEKLMPIRCSRQFTGRMEAPALSKELQPGGKLSCERELAKSRGTGTSTPVEKR